MVFNDTFNNIPVIVSRRSVLSVEETGEKHLSVAETLSHYVVSSTVVMGTDCTGSCKSNYHTIHDHDVPWIRIELNFSWNRPPMTPLNKLRLIKSCYL